MDDLQAVVLTRMDHSRLRFDSAGRRNWEMTSSALRAARTVAHIAKIHESDNGRN
jgi:hypothetical protein